MRRHLDFQGRVAGDIDGLPDPAPSGQARLYFDGLSNTLKTSVNGGAYTGAGASPMTLTAAAAVDIPLTINLHAAQTGDALLVQKSNGTDLIRLQINPAATPVPTQQLLFYPDVAGKGPYLLMSQGNTASGTVNPGFTLGYNQSFEGVQIVAGENALSLQFEADYNDGAQRLMEVYLQYLSADGLTVKRPFMWTINRATNGFTSAILRGNPLTINRDTDDVTAMTIAPNNVVVSAVTGFDTVLYVNAAASRTANLHFGFNGAASFATMATATNSFVWKVNANTGVTHFSSVNGGAGTGISVGISENLAIGTFAVGTSPTSSKGVAIRRRASQTGNMLEIQDSDGTTKLTYWDENARMYQNVPNSAPADADLSNGHVSPYLNEAGNTLLFRVRYSDGTLKTGSVALV